MDWRKRKGIGIHPSWGPSNCSAMVAPTVEAVLTGMMLPVVKVENLRWGNSIFSMGPPAIRHGPSGADASEYLMPYLPAISNCRQFCTDVVIWSYSTVPVAFCLPFLCIFINLEMQERYLPIIRGAGTLFRCVPRHFNHWMPYAMDSGSAHAHWSSEGTDTPDCRLMLLHFAAGTASKKVLYYCKNCVQQCHLYIVSVFSQNKCWLQNECCEFKIGYTKAIQCR